LENGPDILPVLRISMVSKRGVMHDILWVAGVLVAWVLLQFWILPKLGIST
jgi:hypothetical protein